MCFTRCGRTNQERQTPQHRRAATAPQGRQRIRRHFCNMKNTISGNWGFSVHLALCTTLFAHVENLQASHCNYSHFPIKNFSGVPSDYLELCFHGSFSKNRVDTSKISTEQNRDLHGFSLNDLKRRRNSCQISSCQIKSFNREEIITISADLGKTWPGIKPTTFQPVYHKTTELFICLFCCQELLLWFLFLFLCLIMMCHFHMK